MIKHISLLHHPTSLAEHWSRVISAAESPAPYTSPRDGRALRLVPRNERLPTLSTALGAAFAADEAACQEAQAILESLGTRKGAVKVKASPHRAQLAWVRSLAYLQV